MVPCLHQSNISIKRQLRVWKGRKCIHLVSAKKPSHLCGPSNYPISGRWYGADKGNLHALGWTYHHGTVFAPRQYLYQKEATGMERLEMYFPSQCKNPTHLCGPSNHPPHMRWYKVYNGNLRILGRNYRHGNVLAPKECFYKKKAAGMERPEMYCPILCKNLTQLCGP